jgi:hypothetical protein
MSLAGSAIVASGSLYRTCSNVPTDHIESNCRVMEKLERSKFTRAGKVANGRLTEAVLDPDRYPEGTTFIAADQQGIGAILAEAVAEHRPLAIVYPDGRRDRRRASRWRTRLFRAPADLCREVKQGQPAVPLPADYRVEISDGNSRRPERL